MIELNILSTIDVLKANELKAIVDPKDKLKTCFENIFKQNNFNKELGQCNVYLMYNPSGTGNEFSNNKEINLVEEYIPESKYNMTLNEFKEEITNNIIKTNTNFTFYENARITIRQKPILLQIKNNTAINFGYIGPVIIITLLYLKLIQNHKANLVQNTAFILSILHYLKRIYETNYVNVYFGFLDLPSFIGFLFYYWVLYAAIVSYNIFNENYNNDISVHFVIVFSLLMIFSEYNNYYCHMILKNLKIKNKGFRGIPEGNLFNYVSCAHYFWELMSWTFFALMVRTLSAWLFVLYSFISMFFMAYPKHKGYISYFGEKYPKSRKVMIPFLL